MKAVCFRDVARVPTDTVIRRQFLQLFRIIAFATRINKLRLRFEMHVRVVSADAARLSAGYPSSCPSRARPCPSVSEVCEPWLFRLCLVCEGTPEIGFVDGLDQICSGPRSG